LTALQVKALDPKAFAVFGDVIQVPNRNGLSINDGSALRYDDLSRADTHHAGGQTGLSLFVAQPRPLPITLSMLERHPLGSQAFVPLDQQAFIVVVALSLDDDKPDEPHAFLAQADQGINFRRGVWHHPLLAIGKPGRFLVVDRVGPGDNLETIAIKPVSLAL